MKRVKINNYESFRYCELYEITEWRDGCIWRAEPVGFIRAEDECKIDRNKYTTSSLSTDLHKNPTIELFPVYSKEELDR